MLQFKIFQIGFNKCGTISLHYLFQNYCFPAIRSIHWNKGYLARDIYTNILEGKKPLTGYEPYSAYLDMECFLINNDKLNWISIAKNYFDILDINYPNSKFILNTRNIDNWINSRIKHICKFTPIKYGYAEELRSKIPYIEYYKQIYGISNIEHIIEIWKQEWNIHHNNVTSYFAHRPTDLLVFDIEKDPFSKMLDFFKPFGFTFNTNSLPYENKTKDRS